MCNKELNIYEYQNEILKIYEYTQSVFEKFDIKLIAHSGTLLGIIRHDNDFIPWDDDLDVIVSYKQLVENYDDIQKEINEIGNEYHIFNFVKGEDGIRANLNFLRVYSRKKVKVNINDNYGEPYPFIDIMIAAPSNTFKTNFGWKNYSRRHQMLWITRKGFKRYQRTTHKKFNTFWKNLHTYPLKIIYPMWLEDMRIRKPWNLEKGNWNVLRRTDPWSHRNVVYNYDNLIKSTIRGVEIWISGNYEEELVATFGANWRKPKVMHVHSYGEKHTMHQRNMQIRDYLEKKYNSMENENV